jgi:hypothetical protein
MTTALGIIPLTYDTDDLQPENLGIFLEITQGLDESPEVRGKDVTVPGLAGQIPRNRQPHQLRILLTGHVMGVGTTTAEIQSSYRTLARYMRTLFRPYRLPADLVAGPLEDGSTATISARPLNTIWIPEVPSEFSRVSVELFSVDPDWIYT